MAIDDEPVAAAIAVDATKTGEPASTAKSKVITIQHLTRNVMEVHVRAIFEHYGPIERIDFPTYRKCENLVVTWKFIALTRSHQPVRLEEKLVSSTWMQKPQR